MKIVYLLEGTEISGGAKVVLDHAQELARRGHEVTVAGRTPLPVWHSMEGVPFIEDPDFSRLPEAEAGIATFWTTVGPAVDSGRFRKVYHFCQGYEGSFPPYAPIKDKIDAAYALPIPKLLIHSHLEPVLKAAFHSETHTLGQFIDRRLFNPPAAPPPFVPPFRISVVGPFEAELKGVRDALAGLRLAGQGASLCVLHASTSPLSPEELDLGVTDVFLHNLAPAQMANHYRSCHLHVQASHPFEGFPLPPLEAFACGCLPLVSDIPAFTGLPFPRFAVGDAEGLAKLVNECTSDPARCAAVLRDAAPLLEEMTLERVVDRLERVLLNP
jgi:glycosyltransferase involved in cell wall biosynthesis